MLYGIARIGGAETAVKVHLMDDKEDCSRMIQPSQWNFFWGLLFPILGLSRVA